MKTKLRWYILKHKLIKPLRIFKITWCDWCDMLCHNPYLTENDESVCRHCKDDAPLCECCEEIVHTDSSVDMPWGWYCQDCYDAQYG